MRILVRIVLVLTTTCVSIALASCLEEGGDDADGGAGDAGEDTGEEPPPPMELCEGGYGDPKTGLCWEHPYPALDRAWIPAKSYCNGLEAGGHTDWRMPNVDELRSLIRGCDASYTGGACEATDQGQPDHPEGCDGCPINEGPGGGRCYWDDVLGDQCLGPAYWTTSNVYNDVQVWVISFNDAYFGFFSSNGDTEQWVRCVRDY